MGLEDARIIPLPKVEDPRGNLTFLEPGRHLPFTFQRVYYTYDVPGGVVRGGHAHKECEEFVIAVSGSFDVVLDDGSQTRRFFLNRSYYGLYIPRMAWRVLENFSSGSVCLVVASLPYDEADYFRDYEGFLQAVSAHG